MSKALSIGFLGAGKMATALAKGFIRAGLTSTSALTASDPFEAARKSFIAETGAKATASNKEAAQAAQILVIAVKPDQVEGLLQELHSTLRGDQLLISIAAGVSLAKMEAAAPSVRIIRVMPNTPALVGEGASAFALGTQCREGDAVTAQKLLEAVGIAYQVKESLIDAVTGLSGSGPAYAFLMIEALSDGGVAAGLPRDIATKLAAQTLLGSARLLLETGLHPGALKDMVTSPGGTTIDGLHELEKGGVRGALINAVRAAAEKSKRLGQGSK
jgi:pyrroline-5-carboxylate reductase